MGVLEWGRARTLASAGRGGAGGEGGEAEANWECAEGGVSGPERNLHNKLIRQKPFTRQQTYSPRGLEMGD